MDPQLQMVQKCIRKLATDGQLPADLVGSTLNRRTSIESLGIDSLGKMSFILELEKSTQTPLSEKETSALATIGDVCQLLGTPKGETVPADDPVASTEHKIDSRESTLSDFYRVASPDLFAKVREFAGFVEDLRGRGYERYLLPVKQYLGGRAVVDGGNGFGEKEVIVFCSANYLGLSFHPRLSEAVQKSATEFGTSVASVPLMAGSTSVHSQLSRSLADFVGTEDLVLFPTGHAANIGTISALCNARDLVILDKLVHYSILEGVRLAGAPWLSFRHSDPDHLREVLAAAREKHTEGGILVILEGVYGIDGDIAPLPELMKVAQEYGARVMVDDAHATGVLGAEGRGTAEHFGVVEPPDLVMGSLSKSLGSLGGWIATSKETADYLRYFSKTIVFSVGLPSMNVAAALEALGILHSDPSLLAKLRRNASFLKAGLRDLGLENATRSGSAIMSVIVGDEAKLRDVVRDLFHKGVWIEGLPFPAVTRGQERVRFRVSALHTEEDLKQTLEVVADVFLKHGILGKARHRPTPSVPVDRSEFCREADFEAGDYDGIVDLAVESARERNYPLPFVARDFYSRVVHRTRHWATSDPSRWVLKKKENRPVACSMATLQKVHLDKRDSMVGFIGHIHWTAGAEAALGEALEESMAWLRERVDRIYAPIQAPLQVLGGGIVQGGPAIRTPFLEPRTSPESIEVLRQLGFRRHSSHPYVRVSIPESLAELAAPGDKGIAIRPIDRAHFREEIQRLRGPLNRAIGTIDLCSQLSFESFYGIASELRELIVPELWQIAQLGSRVVGFVGAFPDLRQAFLQASGSGGIADIDNMRDVVDRVREGFVAWMAVEPDVADRGVGKKLLARLYQEMLKRDYREALLSWEMKDGHRDARAFYPSPKAIIERLDYEIFDWSRGEVD